ncbi:MAG: transposase, partial [Trueperaceae bacterium]
MAPGTSAAIESTDPTAGDDDDLEPLPAAISAAELVESGALDALFKQIDSGSVRLSGTGGLLPELVKSVLERGLQAELSAHLGYEKGDPAANLFPNSRNGASTKTVRTEVGNVPLEVPRDR